MPTVEDAWERFDAENAQDPKTFLHGGEAVPYELFYAQRLSEWVLRLSPDASPALRLAARSQHIGRWHSPRESYPMDRAGYLRWRADLKEYHAARSRELLLEMGFEPELADRVATLNRKEGLGRDPEVQVLEDALCLVTLEYQMTDLAAKTSREKMITILQRTWRKMSPTGRQAALGLKLEEPIPTLLKEALA